MHCQIRRVCVPYTIVSGEWLTAMFDFDSPEGTLLHVRVYVAGTVLNLASPSSLLCAG